MTLRNSKKDRKECFDKHHYTDYLGRVVMDCHICGGVIVCGTQEWEAEHVVMRALGGKEIKPAHASPCHSNKTKTDIKNWSKGKRVRDRIFGIKRASGQMPGSKRSPWKKKMDGTTERRS